MEQPSDHRMSTQANARFMTEDGRQQNTGDDFIGITISDDYVQKLHAYAPHSENGHLYHNDAQQNMATATYMANRSSMPANKRAGPPSSSSNRQSFPVQPYSDRYLPHTSKLNNYAGQELQADAVMRGSSHSATRDLDLSDYTQASSSTSGERPISYEPSLASQMETQPSLLANALHPIAQQRNSGDLSTSAPQSYNSSKHNMLRASFGTSSSKKPNEFGNTQMGFVHQPSPLPTNQQPPFRPVRSPKSDLRPIRNPQPAFRRARPEGGFISPLQALTVYLSTTYSICNPSFKYNSSNNPRRVLTKPSKGTKNDGYDNEDSDYILYVNDVLGEEQGQKYLILDILGQGTFGQVVKCQNLKTQEIVAIKVIKNKTAYYNQSMMEVTILELLNNRYDIEDKHHILRLHDRFHHKHHLCLVFELLSVNLYDLIKQNQFRGLSTNLVRVFSAQLLDALTVLNEARIIHCDLKPENVLLKNLESPTIKVIDFGSACHEASTVYTYIQSRFYRSPEILIGLPYNSAIDMWSLGCIAGELFLGLPLFPGSSEYNQVSRIIEMLGLPPNYMIEMGKNTHEYFDKYVDGQGRKHYQFKSIEQYSREHGVQEQPSKKYFAATKLEDLIMTYPVLRRGLSPAEREREMQNRRAFIDFLRGLLNLNPIERWSPQQAKLHPFITGDKFTGHFTPPTIPKATGMTPKTSEAHTPMVLSGANSPTKYGGLTSQPPSYNSSLAPSLVSSPSSGNAAYVMDTSPSDTTQAIDNVAAMLDRRANEGEDMFDANTRLPPTQSSSHRPRANTFGAIQIPPQLQKLSKAVSPVGAAGSGISGVQYTRRAEEQLARPDQVPPNWPQNNPSAFQQANPSISSVVQPSQGEFGRLQSNDDSRRRSTRSYLQPQQPQRGYMQNAKGELSTIGMTDEQASRNSWGTGNGYDSRPNSDPSRNNDTGTSGSSSLVRKTSQSVADLHRRVRGMNYQHASERSWDLESEGVPDPPTTGGLLRHSSVKERTRSRWKGQEDCGGMMA
ncbi:hypothetical protein BZG36_03219 [Bifiguratus adelaidae]|uniref:Protein kinase domain-containing protein n=1 Tax=Bifiguratus adelaidae TaxID=1938954 RepID=A0A261XX10_9FUNG|nr:hypothetical protein BZG36_03219 [Bifiguratus adelaidae]